MPSRIRTPHRVPEDNYNRIYGNLDELSGLAECHGSVDLGDARNGRPPHHIRIITPNGNLWDRSHLRILLSPVGPSAIGTVWVDVNPGGGHQGRRHRYAALV